MTNIFEMTAVERGLRPIRRVLALFGMLSALLCLCACGAQSGEDTPFSGGSGTEEDPYLISCTYDLWELAERINSEADVEDFTAAHYLMTADIDLGGRREWMPIGYYSRNQDHFRFEGLFDGGGHTLSGLRIDYSDPLLGQRRTLFGLFGQLEGCVRNLTLSDSFIRAKGDSSVRVGAIAANVSGGSIENCHTTDTVFVSGSYRVGGICGMADGSSVLSLCSNAAQVRAFGFVGDAGGIAAYMACPAESCSNSGAVSSRQGHAAGIAVSARSLTDCVNSGSISAEDYAAGIVCHFGDGALNPGMNDSSVALLRCVNSGSVSSEKDVAGGIAAACRSGRIENCENSGSVSAPGETGGILAYYQHGVFGLPCESFAVCGCKNSGNILSTGNSSAGGICGMVYGEKTGLIFENCLNMGKVEATGRTDTALCSAEAGGIIGSSGASRLEIINCSNFGAVSGYAVCGGIVGSSDPVRGEGETLLLLQGCSNQGDVFALCPGGLTQELYAGGIVGRCPIEAVSDELLPMFDVLSIENCVNLGRLDGTRDAAPLRVDDICASDLSDLR